MSEDQRERAVYGFYDATDRLIYVGCTVNLEQRTDQHRSQSWWWWQAVRRDVLATAQSKAEGSALEREAILELRPRWNKDPMPPQQQWTADDYFDLILTHLAGRGRCCTEYFARLRRTEEKLVLAANAYLGLDLPVEPLPLLDRVKRDVVSLPVALQLALRAGRIIKCVGCDARDRRIAENAARVRATREPVQDAA